MKQNLDFSKTYAIALEGGGAKGAYQIGVVKALCDMGLKYNAVAGTSVGAINGAMLAMGRVDEAVELWKKISFTDVMDVDEKMMEEFYTYRWDIRDLPKFNQFIKKTIAEKGIDTEPLNKLLAKYVDEEEIRKSDIDFYTMTYANDRHKGLAVDMKKLPKGQMADMVKASSYFPLFKHELICGERFTDGYKADLIPVKVLTDNNYRDILVVRVLGFGKVLKPINVDGLNVYKIVPPKEALGLMLDFNPKRVRYELKLGYLDGLKQTPNFYGKRYCIQRSMTNREAYDVLKKNYPLMMRRTNLIVKHKKISYYDVLTYILDIKAVENRLCKVKIYKDRDLVSLLLKR